MGTFVAGSHELSPSINYLLHNKILSGQILSSSSSSNHSHTITAKDNNNSSYYSTRKTTSARSRSTSISTSSSSNSNTQNVPTATTTTTNTTKSTKTASVGTATIANQRQQKPTSSDNNTSRHHHHHLHEQQFHQTRAIPHLPPIKCSEPAQRLSPLTVEDYERDYRESATDLQLVERVFYGGIASNQLRAALWPYLFGLVKHRGRFKVIKDTEGNQLDLVYIEHEENVKRWRELDKLYHSYQAQWESIMPDQELRFSTFRERKSLIERDVIRSDRSHPFYADSSANLTSFTTLLMTYMMYDFDIGYLQGMSDLAAPILYVFNGDLVKSFWVFVEVMKLFRRNFEYSQKTIHFQLNCLYRLVKITDPKFAQYLNENECSNCFFAFRCIVCQFKRELMKDEDNYTKVLSLWDTIWCVQRRHELLAKSKYVHTFTIANGHSSAASSSSHRYLHHQQNKYKHHKQSHNHKSPTSQSQHQHQQQPLLNGHKTSASSASIISLLNGHGKASCNNNNNGHITNQNGYQNGHSTRSQKYSDGLMSSSCNGISGSKTSTGIYKQSPLKSNGSSPCMNGNGYSGNNRYSGYENSNNGLYHSNGSPIGNGNNRWATNNGGGASPMSSHSPVSPLSINNCHNYNQKPAPVKQEQIVYTKETFYSSFDPNQADIPRFELTETEKFVLSLCLSLIRHERNHILMDKLDASEIHQHFINPHLSSHLDSFIESAYNIYHFLNTDCDMQLLVKGANEVDLSPSLGGVDGPGVSPKEDTADTYDLLRDYLIISPSSYNTSRYKYSVSQKSWDHFLNNSGPMAD